MIRNKLIAGVDGFESVAARKHTFHIRHLRCVEVGEVERFERGAVSEHIVHICHILGVEVCEIERFERPAVTEHIAHIRHVLGVKILNAFYCGQIRAVIEPHITARWSCIGKRSIENHLLDLFIYSRPTTIKVISSFGLGRTAFECKRSCASFKLGISRI